MDFATAATYISGLSFLAFGISCQTSDYMKREFIRYGYARERALTGYLQIAGGAGLLIGHYGAPLLAAAAAAGLGLMMAYGFGVRLYIRDTLWQATPAFLYAALNAYLTVHYGQQL